MNNKIKKRKITGLAVAIQTDADKNTSYEKMLFHFYLKGGITKL